MAKPRTALRVLLLAVALSTSAAMSLRPSDIFARDGTCGDPTFKKCSQAGFPDNFCCQPQSSCISLAGGTTILCCPDSDANQCNTIVPIVCNIDLQDASKNPKAVVKSTALTGKLPTCGSNCCPFGYHCDQGNACVQDDDQSKKPELPGSSSSAPAATSTAAVTSPATSTAAKTSGGASDTAAPQVGGNPEGSAAAGGSSFPTAAVVGGVIGAIVVIASIVAAIFICRHRRQQRQTSSRNSSASFGNFGPMTISAPISHASIQRSDFNAKHKDGPSPHPQAAAATPASHHTGGLGSNWSTPTQSNERRGDGRYDDGGDDPFRDVAPYYVARHRLLQRQQPQQPQPQQQPERRDSFTGSLVSADSRSHHDSAEIRPIRGMRHSRHLPRRGERQQSDGSESIAIGFEDPRRNTTWTDIQINAADAPPPPVRHR